MLYIRSLELNHLIVCLWLDGLVKATCAFVNEPDDFSSALSKTLLTLLKDCVEFNVQILNDYNCSKSILDCLYFGRLKYSVDFWVTFDL